MEAGEIFKKSYRGISLIFFFIFFFVIFSKGNEPHKEQKSFNPGDVIMHHISDAHEWHLATIGETHIAIPLLVILYAPAKGLNIFFSNKLTHGFYKGYKMEHGQIVAEASDKFYDFSITKNVASMLLSVVILFFIFISVGRRYKHNTKSPPKGLQSFLEPIIIFIKDEVAIPTLGKKYPKYLPFLLSVFFFIWVNNLLGLLPGAANVTGNIAVTMILALFTFLMILFSANKYYWGHIIKPPGVPIWLLPIMTLVEFIGIFTKPFALMIRLFANISAGHIIILSIISLIFIFGEKDWKAGAGISIVSVAFSVFMFCLELLVAVLQAYIFTMLSSLFIGEAVADHSNDKAH